jgi:hypothetical protein
MKSARLGFLVWLTLGGVTVATAGEWSFDLRAGDGEVTSDLFRATQFVLERPPFRFTVDESLGYDVSSSSLTTFELRRFWSPRWASSLRARYSVLELDPMEGDSWVLTENTETGESDRSLVAFDRDPEPPSRVEAIELALGLEFHPAPQGRVDPFVGVSIGTVDFQPKDESPVREVQGDLGFGATAGLNVDLTARSYFVAAARWDSLEADPFRSLGPLSTDVELDDSLTTTTLELGVGVRFGSGGD